MSTPYNPTADDSLDDRGYEESSQPQAHHSPLPDRSTKAQWETLANESIADAGYWKAEARKAQASVNHAAQLAEALREVVRALPPRYEHSIAIGMMALAAYESEAQ